MQEISYTEFGRRRDSTALPDDYAFGMSTPIAPLADGVSDRRAEEFVDTVRIARARHDLYAFWRDFANLPVFMEKVRKVTEVDSISSIWTVADAAGTSADWEFIVTDDEVDRLIAWSASGNTPVKYSGRVEFKDASPLALGDSEVTATEVTATLKYEAASGLIDGLIARMSGASAGHDDPAVQTRSDLLRFKELMENPQTPPSAPPAG